MYSTAPHAFVPASACGMLRRMEYKTLVWMGIVIGGFLGGLIPSLWGAGALSVSGIVFSSLGALAGIWITFKLTH